MKVGAFLKQKRIKCGLSQTELATSLGYATSRFVKNWERGASKPPIGKLRKICALLKMEREEFYRSYVDLLFAEYHKSPTNMPA
ncbi:MAG: helix-turn-helix domain-containing protein [Pseudobdellovibrionaceae bacterium]